MVDSCRLASTIRFAKQPLVAPPSLLLLPLFLHWLSLAESSPGDLQQHSLAQAADRLAEQALESLVRPGALISADGSHGGPSLEDAQHSLEAGGRHGLLALLYLAGVPDVRGRLDFPWGFPRNISSGMEHLAKAVSGPRKRVGDGGGDPWAFSVLGLLLSLGWPGLEELRLEVMPGPEVRVVNPSALLSLAQSARQSSKGSSGQKPSRRTKAFDRAGAAYWEAAERKEPLGSIAFASLVRRGLTEVPMEWEWDASKDDREVELPVLARAPEVLVARGAALGSSSPERACRALGTMLGVATEASHNEQPLLDKAALTWKAWRHRQQRMPEDEEWELTKEHVEFVRHAADVVKEPEKMREMAAIHFTGHTEGKVEQNKEKAESYWAQAAKQGDVWSAWHAALSFISDGRHEAAEPFLDIVGNASAGPLTYMAVHFKHRIGIGVPKDPQLAGLFLKASADLGNSNAQLILAHSYMGYRHGNMAGVEPPGGDNKAAALVYYKAAAANGRLVPKLNVALLTAQGADPEVRDRGMQCVLAYRQHADVVHTAHPGAHLLFAHARRAYDLGDSEGSRLRFALLSDGGFLFAHLNAAWLWDQESASQHAYFYQRRAASSGHPLSMSDLSARLIRTATALSESDSSQISETRILQASAYRWSALAAEQGDARGIFDQAFMLQFGLGVAQNETLARELYGQLLGGGSGWPARVAALSWLGFSQARTYFLSLRDSSREVVEAATTAAAALADGARTFMAAVGASVGLIPQKKDASSSDAS
ncbi:unnamed protein product [Polarella glacialis]|uniref:Uncharacterized protein n=1 Tax=Polarella glacialis TaxID=89957 RepID=A0A813H7L8_POLGL|nr:unnamed protein product [Polarella glacialis]